MGLFSRTRAFFKTKKTIEPQERIVTHLANRVGGGIGLNINGAITPQVFEYVIPQGKNAWIKRATVIGSNASIEMATFVGIPVLPVGLVVRVVDENDNIIKIFTEDHNIKTTLSLAGFSSSSIASVIDRLGALEDSFLFINDFRENTGEEMFMREGWKFQIIVNDDLTGITTFGALLKGIVIDKF